jgi:hypothetical protein
LLSNVQRRSGLRIRCDQEVYPLVKKACINFAFWLRLNMEFPIRVASGDYQELTSERGEENAIAAILISVARQIIHYQQWIEDREFNEQEAEEEAEKLVDDYYEWTE